MAAKLTTDFIKIAQSGPCADGRTIEAQWLRDMAATYDPEVYTAYIWPNHIRWGNNYGKVLELSASDDAGVTSLLARLAPNAQYVWENQFDQLLHFSIEVSPNFAASGKAYLSGLAITDSPASLGTEALKFSLRRAGAAGQDIQIFSNAPAVPLSHEADRIPSWFTKIFASMTPNSASSGKDNPMDQKQFEALSQRLDGMEKGMADIKAFMSAAKADSPAPAAEDTAPKHNVENAENQDFSAFGTALAPVVEGLKGVNDQLAIMHKRLEAGQAGTPFSASSGPADDTAPLL